MSEDNKPIGWWLKHLDALIEQAFTRALAAEGIGRRHWQLLTVACGSAGGGSAGGGSAGGGSAGGGSDLATIGAELAPFWPAGADRDAEVAALVGELAERGWLTVDGEVVSATPEGVQARARIAEVVAEQRRRSTAGIEAGEYAQVLDTLRRMAANLAHQG